jgi:hypothetical protein
MDFSRHIVNRRHRLERGHTSLAATSVTPARGIEESVLCYCNLRRLDGCPFPWIALICRPYLLTVRTASSVSPCSIM